MHDRRRRQKIQVVKDFQTKAQTFSSYMQSVFSHKAAEYHYWRELLHGSAMTTINITSAAHYPLETKNTHVYSLHIQPKRHPKKPFSHAPPLHV